MNKNNFEHFSVEFIEDRYIYYHTAFSIDFHLIAVELKEVKILFGSIIGGCKFQSFTLQRLLSCF